jgi:hypothetical protein
MAEGSTHPKRRHWADVAAIVAGVSAIGLAIWPNLAADEGGQGVGLGSAALASAAAGALAILGLFLAQRSPAAGRLPLAAGGLLLLATPFVFARQAGFVPTLQMILGVAMLAAAAFVGRMPSEGTTTD